MILKKIVDDRTKTGRREEDALQFLMDQGDSLMDIITVSFRFHIDHDR
jgi:sterol 14-demethylase